MFFSRNMKLFLKFLLSTHKKIGSPFPSRDWLLEAILKANESLCEKLKYRQSRSDINWAPGSHYA